MLIRDVASTNRGDALFPWMRTFDPYAGHSWASGSAAYYRDNGHSQGNNQESSSEAINFAASLIAWGEATNQQDVIDLGIYLFATENEAINQYWFDVDGEVFPDSYKHSVAGRVWGNSIDYGTWFGTKPEFVHGIQFLPLSGSSLYLGQHPEYVQRNIQDYEASDNQHDAHPEVTRWNYGGGLYDSWAGILYKYMALENPQRAYQLYQGQR